MVDAPKSEYIKLTIEDGRPLIVRREAISAFRPNEGDDKTLVWLVGVTNYTRVEEEFEVVLAKVGVDSFTNEPWLKAYRREAG